MEDEIAVTILLVRSADWVRVDGPEAYRLREGRKTSSSRWAAG
jgi:hypothetical protein